MAIMDNVTKTIHDILTEIYGTPVVMAFEDGKGVAIMDNNTLPIGYDSNTDGSVKVNGGKLILKDGVYSYYPYDINEPTIAIKKCTCGATKTYPNEPNLEFLHSDWCDLYKSNK